LPESEYSFYGSDLIDGIINKNQWSGSLPLSTLDCTTDYKQLYGIANSIQNISKKNSITFIQPNLPAHRGLIIVVNVFKIDSW
jgi:hypothetical protein